MSKEAISINVKTLTQQVNDGMKKDALALHYGIPVSQMGAALKQAGLKIRKFHAPSFVLVNEEETEVEMVVMSDSEVGFATDLVQDDMEEKVSNQVEAPSIWKD